MAIKIKMLRLQKRLNQTKFWAPLGVTQSGASRYEKGRRLPRPVQILLHIAYGTKTERKKELKNLGIDL